MSGVVQGEGSGFVTPARSVELRYKLDEGGAGVPRSAARGSRRGRGGEDAGGLGGGGTMPVYGVNGGRRILAPFEPFGTPAREVDDVRKPLRSLERSRRTPARGEGGRWGSWQGAADGYATPLNAVLSAEGGPGRGRGGREATPATPGMPGTPGTPGVAGTPAGGSDLSGRREGEGEASSLALETTTPAAGGDPEFGTREARRVSLAPTPLLSATARQRARVLGERRCQSASVSKFGEGLDRHLITDLDKGTTDAGDVAEGRRGEAAKKVPEKKKLTLPQLGRGSSELLPEGWSPESAQALRKMLRPVVTALSMLEVNGGEEGGGGHDEADKRSKPEAKLPEAGKSLRGKSPAERKVLAEIQNIKSSAALQSNLEARVRKIGEREKERRAQSARAAMQGLHLERMNAPSMLSKDPLQPSPRRVVISAASVSPGLVTPGGPPPAMSPGQRVSKTPMTDQKLAEHKETRLRREARRIDYFSAQVDRREKLKAEERKERLARAAAQERMVQERGWLPLISLGSRMTLLRDALLRDRVLREHQDREARAAAIIQSVFRPWNEARKQFIRKNAAVRIQRAFFKRRMQLAGIKIIEALRQVAAQTSLGRALKRFHSAMHRIKAAFVHNHRYNVLQRSLMVVQWEQWEIRRYKLQHAKWDKAKGDGKGDGKKRYQRPGSASQKKYADVRYETKVDGHFQVRLEEEGAAQRVPVDIKAELVREAHRAKTEAHCANYAAYVEECETYESEMRSWERLREAKLMVYGVDDVPPPPEPRTRPSKSVILSHADLLDLERRGQMLKKERKDAEIQRQIQERSRMAKAERVSLLPPPSRAGSATASGRAKSTPPSQ